MKSNVIRILILTSRFLFVRRILTPTNELCFMFITFVYIDKNYWVSNVSVLPTELNGNTTSCKILLSLKKSFLYFLKFETGSIRGTLFLQRTKRLSTHDPMSTITLITFLFSITSSDYTFYFINVEFVPTVTQMNFLNLRD